MPSVCWKKPFTYNAMHTSSARPSTKAADHQCPIPAWPTRPQGQASAIRLNGWQKTSRPWLSKQRWLIQEQASGLWLENLTPMETQGEWQPVWCDRMQRGLQFATEEMGRKVLRCVQERINADLQLSAATFVAPACCPTAWRPLDA